MQPQPWRTAGPPGRFSSDSETWQTHASISQFGDLFELPQWSQAHSSLGRLSQARVRQEEKQERKEQNKVGTPKAAAVSWGRGHVAPLAQGEDGGGPGPGDGGDAHCHGCRQTPAAANFSGKKWRGGESQGVFNSLSATS